MNPRGSSVSIPALNQVQGRLSDFLSYSNLAAYKVTSTSPNKLCVCVLSVYVYVYVCMQYELHVYVCVCLFICVCFCACMNRCMRCSVICACMYICVRVRACVFVYVRLGMCVRVLLCVRVSVGVCECVHQGQGVSVHACPAAQVHSVIIHAIFASHAFNSIIEGFSVSSDSHLCSIGPEHTQINIFCISI